MAPRYLPTIKIRNPKTDICDTCMNMRVNNMVAEREDHLLRAMHQRLCFNENIRSTRLSGNSHTVQLTFDYAEKILLPRFTDTPKDIFYKIGLKVDLFGIGNNTMQLQTNYVLPEGHWPGDKGINSIASFLYHDILLNHRDKTSISYMADNCGGQNKNKYMMWFLSFLSITLGKTISLRFLIAGHTKNFCDACFGLCKRSLRGKDIFTPHDVIAAYKESGRCNLVATPRGVTFYDWKKFLAQFYGKQVTDISRMHEFQFTPESLGFVAVKKYENLPQQWSNQNLLRPTSSPANVIAPSGEYRPLADFVIDPTTYSLGAQKVKTKDGDITRLQYLQDDIVNHYYVGSRVGHALLYFEDGSTSLS